MTGTLTLPIGPGSLIRAAILNLSVTILIASGCSPPPANSPAAVLRTEEKAVDLNRADVEELKRLPGIGNILAARIVEHRTEFGVFRRAEHLMLVRGVSEKKFLALSRLVVVRKTESR